MSPTPTTTSKPIMHEVVYFLWILVGAVLSAFSIEVFLIPNRLIDGGIVGVAMILGNLISTSYIPYFLIVLNLPFLYLGYRFIGKIFVLHMLTALLLFAVSMIGFQLYWPMPFIGESLEVVVIGGAILGIGLGMIIRAGGCLDGTEILGIIVNKKTGFTVGQTVLVCNVFIFAAAGIVFQDWHPPILSLITYMVAIKAMDTVIVGLDETKSVLIISQKSRQIAEVIVHELGLGLTIMYGRGGFTGEDREILYVTTERLQLAELKELVQREDAQAFIAVQNLHEVASGNAATHNHRKRRTSSVEKLISPLLQKRGSQH